MGLEALDRMKRFVIGNEVPPDAVLPLPAGAGTVADPLVIGALPFVDHAALKDATAALSSYGGACGGSDDEVGPERAYRFTTDVPVAARALLVPRNGDAACSFADCKGLRDVALHVFRGAPETGACFATDNTILQGTLPPGDYTFVVDSVDAADPEEVFFTLFLCNDGDPLCTGDMKTLAR